MRLCIRELRDSVLGKSAIVNCMVVVAGLSGYITNMQLDRMAVAVEWLMIGKRVEVNLKPLHHQERQHQTQHRRAAVRVAE